MSCYDELPQDFHDHWVQNLAYCLWNYFYITKVFQKKDNNIIMYKITSRNGKTEFVTTVNYSISIQNYTVEGTRLVNNNGILKEEVFGQKFLKYQDVLDYLWELDKTFEINDILDE